MSSKQRTSSLYSRRGFFHSTGLALTGAALAPTLAQAAAPVQRNGSSHMKLSLAAYSFNRVLLKRPSDRAYAEAKMTMEDFIDFCAEQNLDACEPTSYYFPGMLTPEYLLSIKQRAFRLGLDISGTAIGNDFCKPEGKDWEKEIDMTKEWIDHAAILGAPVIRIFAGNVPKGDTEEAALARCIKGIDTALEYAAEKGVFLALENHGGITATPKQMMRIVDGVKDSPWFGVNFDSGNFQTDDPYRDLAVIAPYAVNAQIKVKIRPNGKHEDTDFKRIITMLKDAGYRGYIVLEYEESQDPFKAIPEHLARLREAIHG